MALPQGQVEHLVMKECLTRASLQEEALAAGLAQRDTAFHMFEARVWQQVSNIAALLSVCECCGIPVQLPLLNTRLSHSPIDAL